MHVGVETRVVDPDHPSRFAFKLGFRRREYYASLLALVPALTLYTLFIVYPLFQSFFYSFTDWNGYSRTFNWVGLQNFLTVFRDPQNIQAFQNTFYFCSVALTTGFPL